jgi:hypothetical protein
MSTCVAFGKAVMYGFKIDVLIKDTVEMQEQL